MVEHVLRRVALVLAAAAAMALAQENARQHIERGQTFVEHHEFEKAAAEFRTAISLDDTNSASYRSLGEALECEDPPDIDGAESAYKKAISLNAQDAEAHFDLGQLLKAIGDLEPAIREFRSALLLNESPAWRFPLAIALDDNGNFVEAKVEYEAFAVAFPDNANAHERYAASLETNGDIQNAIKEYKQALDLNPNLLAAKKALAKLQGSSNRGIPPSRHKDSAEPITNNGIETGPYYALVIGIQQYGQGGI